MLNSEKFADILIDWSQDNNRNLPWKTDRDPYKIWLSEIILQQTRVLQGTPYYLKFVEEYPDVFTLAAATENQVLKSWEGLGYYTRARNLHKTAKIVAYDHNGVFPDTYAGLLKLPGIGPYSAAAIASFAYDEPVPVIDGNVLRFLSRLLEVEIPVDTKEGRAVIEDYAKLAIHYTTPSLFNQAIMDFGSLACKVSSPLCHECPFSYYCGAYKSNKVDVIPIKKQKVVKQDRHIVYLEFVIEDNYTVLQRRESNDIWKGMFQFPTLEGNNIPIELAIQDTILELFEEKTPYKVHRMNSNPLKQVLTHRIIHATFYQIIVNKKPTKIKKTFNLVERVKIRNFAMPKILTDYLKYSIK